MSWSHYLLQINIYLIIFYTFYRLLLAKETYFTLNRIYLICSGIFSLTIPFIKIDWFSKQEISQQIYVQVEQLNQFVVQDTATAAIASQFSWASFIVSVYLLGVFFFLIRFAIKLLAVKQMFKNIRSGLAFSFWNKKAVSPNLPEIATVNHHEDIHIKQLHTADIIFFELLGIIIWFNPIIYLYKEAVKNIHEYLADEAAAKFQGDKEVYSMLLLNQAFGVNVNALTNGFFKKSMIKKRIFMLYKERSRKMAILKYGIFVPLFAAALLLSSATVRKNKQLLAASEKIELTEVKEAVAEVLDLPKETFSETAIETKVKLQEPKVKVDNGLGSFYKFIGNHIKYPSTASNNNIQGNLVVNFIVKDKKLGDIVIEPKLGYGADEEAAIALSKYNGTALNDGKYSIKIEYRLNGTHTPVLNENATVKKGYNNLNTITVMGYAAKQQNTEGDNIIYSFVSMETPPSYPGGIAKFYQFLGENIKYPEEAHKENIQGNVFVSFTVEKDGSLNDIKIDRKLGYGADEEAIRVLQLSKKWNPGIQKGKPVRVKYNLPIKFALKNQPQSEARGNVVDNPNGLKPKKEGIAFKGIEFNSETHPLVVLNGKIVESETLKTIDPKDIESINVLKDFIAIKQYGDKGKNGVIVIKSKIISFPALKMENQ